MKTPKLTNVLAAAFLSAALLAPVARGQTRMTAPWGELAQALNGRVVDTVLLDGTALRGRVLNVTDNVLLFGVEKTSNPTLHPKGEVAVPQGQVKVFSYTYRNGNRGRVLGTAIGGAAGAVPVILVGTIANNEGAAIKGNVAGVLAGIVGAGVALGYGVGHAADTKTMMVFVVDGVE